MRAIRSVGTVTVVLAAVALAVPAGAVTATPSKTPAHDTTSAKEALRVDRVPTPQPAWFDCSSLFEDDDECATVQLPLDYDNPHGATTSVAVLRLKAPDQAHKIGTLFVNPGGPGGSGVLMAASAPLFLNPELLARFDIVGVDPRGTNFSDNVRCWENAGQQSEVLTAISIPFPWTAEEETAYVKSSRAFGKACSSTGRPLTGSMSTAEVARDMDVLRRAVGDRKLTYLGFSYGTYLGNVYANMFPDRVRAVAIDGVLDPLAWAGTKANLTTPQTALTKSGEASARALHEILLRCKTAGDQVCNFAAAGDPEENYAEIIASLKQSPLVITDPNTGAELLVLTYATLINVLLVELYYPEGFRYVDGDLSLVLALLQATAPEDSSAAAAQATARTALVSKARAVQTAKNAAAAIRASQGAAVGYEFPYDNAFEALQTVMCTDGINPRDAGKWPTYADDADRNAPDFGRIWTWTSSPCASKTWTVRDEDAFTGPFTRRTVNPLLVVGNYWDPATNYDSAVKAASLLPNSRLLSSDSWGHTAYGSSACVTDAVDAYLLTRELPAKGTVCVGELQPFTTPLAAVGNSAKRSLPEGNSHLPPVVPPFPGAVPRT